MYNVKVINKSVPEKIFKDTCFHAVSDAKFKLKNSTFIPVDLDKGVFLCNGTSSENLEVVVSLRHYMSSKKYVEGVDYFINILIKN